MACITQKDVPYMTEQKKEGSGDQPAAKNRRRRTKNQRKNIKLFINFIWMDKIRGSPSQRERVISKIQKAERKERMTDIQTPLQKNNKE